eukprot:351489-Chlamydomonas_euryale.AAC.6
MRSWGAACAVQEVTRGAVGPCAAQLRESSAQLRKSCVQPEHACAAISQVGPCSYRRSHNRDPLWLASMPALSCCSVCSMEWRLGRLC